MDMLLGSLDLWRSVFFLLSLISVKCLSVSESVENDLLFVLHDAGESLGLQPVVDDFIAKNYLNVSILCLGEQFTCHYYVVLCL